MQQSQSSSNSGFYKNSRQGSVPTTTVVKKKAAGESRGTNNKIRVCVRVRPLLPHEKAKDEVIYYPTNDGNDNLMVSNSGL
jgi:hypothetical protein